MAYALSDYTKINDLGLPWRPVRAIVAKRCEIWPRLLLINNSKSLTPFQMRWKSSILDLNVIDNQFGRLSQRELGFLYNACWCKFQRIRRVGPTRFSVERGCVLTLQRHATDAGTVATARTSGTPLAVSSEHILRIFLHSTKSKKQGIF